MSRKVAPKTAGRTMPAGKHSDERMVALFLDMLAAERGAGKNTLAAYGRDLAWDFFRYTATFSFSFLSSLPCSAQGDSPAAADRKTSARRRRRLTGSLPRARRCRV